MDQHVTCKTLTDRLLCSRAVGSFPSVLGTASMENLGGKLGEIALVLRGQGENFEDWKTISKSGWCIRPFTWLHE